MKLIVTSLVAIVFVALGSFAAIVVKSATQASASTAKVAKDDHGADRAENHGDHKPDKKKAKKDDHGDDHGSGSSSGGSYYKFSREFVVPIMRGGQVTSLIILHINLETDSSTADKLFADEPKLRDNIMTTLIGLSNDGVTLEQPTEIQNYETIRASILTNLQDSIDEGIQNVLIVDMAKQNL